MAIAEPLVCWAVTAPGLEALAAVELTRWGAHPGATEPGGVLFHATTEQLADLLLQVRSINRLTVRLAEFSARTFGELERHAQQIDWSQIIAPGASIHFRVTSKKSRLYHQDAIAERLEKIALGQIAGCTAVRAPGVAEELEAELTLRPQVQRIIVRIMRDQVTLSADASGGLLHRRGWRHFAGKAPLRETLAAAMLLALEWDGERPLTDPMAGSGTIAIEVALAARCIAPGRGRRFAVENWPMVDDNILRLARDRATARELPQCQVSITAFDRDEGAVEGARANAERAGVAEDLRIARATIAMLPPDDGSGLLVTNPPYGTRVGERLPLRDLYATLGRIARERRPQWSLALLSADPLLTGHLGTTMHELWQTTNGGIPIRLVRDA